MQVGDKMKDVEFYGTLIITFISKEYILVREAKGFDCIKYTSDEAKKYLTPKP